MRSLPRTLCTVAWLVLLGCGDAAAPAGAPATFSAIYPLIFPRATKAQCTFCHALPPNEISNGKLSMGSDKAAAYLALMGKTSASGKCAGKAYIVPGKPDESLFLTKVTSPACGDRMPLGGDPLTADEIEMIRSWITAGAKDD